MAHLNIERVSLASRDREKEEQKKALRKKTLFVLVHQFLEENGCLQAADALKSDCKFCINDYVVCDNVFLESILQDFESYYFLRYQKLPQVVKKVPENKKQPSSEKLKTNRLKSAPKVIASSKIEKLEANECFAKNIFLSDLCTYDWGFSGNDSQFCKSPGFFENHSNEWRSLASVIMQDFGTSNKTVLWSDLVGLQRAKQVLKEAIIYPLKYKELFSSGLVSWKSVLLYGPTGTGKTSLASAVASESKAVFFNVSVSALVSKWRGESEKLVKVLFDLAKYYAPSVIFIDEIDSLVSHRGGDHEASRRMKTEFFSQIDNIFSNNLAVFVLGATNMPWELDQAILRRMEKRLFISLPSSESRALLFEKFLPSRIKICDNTFLKTELDYHELAFSSEHYSASDIEIACKEAKMNLLRHVLTDLEECSHDKTLSKHVNIQVLKMTDVKLALSNTQPSSVNLAEKYRSWKENHGSE